MAAPACLAVRLHHPVHRTFTLRPFLACLPVPALGAGPPPRCAESKRRRVCSWQRAHCQPPPTMYGLNARHVLLPPASSSTLTRMRLCGVPGSATKHSARGGAAAALHHLGEFWRVCFPHLPPSRFKPHALHALCSPVTGCNTPSIPRQHTGIAVARPSPFFVHHIGASATACYTPLPFTMPPPSPIFPTSTRLAPSRTCLPSGGVAATWWL